MIEMCSPGERKHHQRIVKKMDSPLYDPNFRDFFPPHEKGITVLEQIFDDTPFLFWVYDKKNYLAFGFWIDLICKENGIFFDRDDQEIYMFYEKNKKWYILHSEDFQEMFIERVEKEARHNKALSKEEKKLLLSIIRERHKVKKQALEILKSRQMKIKFGEEIAI